MEKLFANLKDILTSGQDAVIAGIISSSGSTPRGPGAKMLVTKRGRTYGTVGGGAIEYEAEKLALSHIEAKSCGTHEFSLSQNQVRDIGMVCGGKVLLYFQYISCDSSETAAICDFAIEKIKSGEACRLVTDMENGKMAVHSDKSGLFGMDEPLPELKSMLGERPAILEIGARRYFVEPLSGFGSVYIFGGGHVAQELVPAASRVGFRCVVLDDWPDFTRPELFAGVSETRLIDFSKIDEFIKITNRDYIVIMTRGHKADTVLQAQAMRSPARYIGVIGSRSKIAHVSAQMRELGFTDDDLARVKTPIGLDIDAETPAEIAVSITAELIMVRAKEK